MIISLLAGMLAVACASPEKAATSKKKEPEILYIYPDGKMEFNGRFLNEDEVIIYKDSFEGGRAAVLLRIPFREDIFRD